MLVESLEEFVEEEPGEPAVLYEMLSASQHSEEIRAELAELYRRWRRQLADALRAKQREGVVALDADPEAVASMIFALGDGMGLQLISDPSWDSAAALELGVRTARRLLGALTDPSVRHITVRWARSDPEDLAGWPTRVSRHEGDMQQAMDRLTAVLERRRWLVHRHLGRPAAGALSRSRPADRAPDERRLLDPGLRFRSGRPRTGRLRGRPAETLAVVVARASGASTADVRRELERVDEIVARQPQVELPTARRRPRSETPALADRDRDDRRDRHRRTRPRTSRSTCARSSASERAPRRTASRPTWSASRRSGPACRTSPRRTSRRPRAPGSRSCC